MDASRGYITTLVDSGQINEATRSGISEDFLDQDCAPVYSYIKRHYKEYKDVPSRDAVIRAFPNFAFGQYREPLQYFIDVLKEGKRKSILDEKVHKIADVYENNTKTAESLIREALSDLQITETNFKDVDLAATALDRIREYGERKENPGATGILSNWSKLDYQTLGWHPEEFVVLVGEKYMGKSWIMLWLAHQAAMQNERVLFITQEMSQEAVTKRHDSIYAGVRFDALRRGELTNTEEKRYEEKMEELSNANYHFTIAREGVNTIEDIEQKAVESNSTVIFGDSIYLFLPDHRQSYTGEVQKRLEVSRACKRTARRLGIPFVASVQAGRKKSQSQKPDLDSIEWSNAFSQDADTVFYIEKDDLDRELGRQRLNLLKSRDGDITEFYINNDFDYMKFDERKDETTEPSTQIFEDDEELILDGEE